MKFLIQKVASRYLQTRITSRLRKAIEKYYKKEKYTSGVYPGSYAKKFNQRYEPKNVEKNIKDHLRQCDSPNMKNHFLERVQDYFEDPQLARGYSIVEKAFDDTYDHFHESYDEYSDEDSEW